MRFSRELVETLPSPVKTALRGARHGAESARLLASPPRLRGLSLAERRAFALQLERISRKVHCPHRQRHVVAFMEAVSWLPPDLPGAIVEAGCFKGGSTAKFSLLANSLGRELVVCDSFEGLPANDEAHSSSILGHCIEGWFEEGKFRGGLEEVRHNVSRYGHLDACRFVPGWYEDSLPTLDEPLCAAYIDVDLAASTRTCLKHLYPLVQPGGIIMSQDGDFPLVIQVFNDDRFWEEEVGCPKPEVQGLGTAKMLKIVKPA